MKKVVKNRNTVLLDVTSQHLDKLRLAHGVHIKHGGKSYKKVIKVIKILSFPECIALHLGGLRSGNCLHTVHSYLSTFSTKTDSS